MLTPDSRVAVPCCTTKGFGSVLGPLKACVPAPVLITAPLLPAMDPEKRLVRPEAGATVSVSALELTRTRSFERP